MIGNDPIRLARSSRMYQALEAHKFGCRPATVAIAGAAPNASPRRPMTEILTLDALDTPPEILAEPVERTHSWINRFRRLLIRWEKRTDNFLAMFHFACALICVQRAAWGQFG
jgi:hypothetical protein